MLEKAKEMAGPDGKVIAGILTDAAIKEHKARPLMSFEHRIEIARAIRYVDIVVPQETYSPIEILHKICPDILIRSDNLSDRDTEAVRTTMRRLGGQVVIVPYHSGISSTLIKRNLFDSFKIATRGGSSLY
jgi:glycerol-3-phosphate cytidylyltransferase-like family protein